MFKIPLQHSRKADMVKMALEPDRWRVLNRARLLTPSLTSGTSLTSLILFLHL